jgi:hypothetical protein
MTSFCAVKSAQCPRLYIQIKYFVRQKILCLLSKELNEYMPNRCCMRRERESTWTFRGMIDQSKKINVAHDST